jgi:MFS transporter, MCT family, solute carrier family 16 (monocarboxylic acid transporters), member 6
MAALLLMREGLSSLRPTWFPASFSAPPEGGWGWIVVFASFAVHFAVLGVQYGFGVVYRALLDDASLNGDRSATAWVGSIAIALMLGTGIVTGKLVSLFGARPVVIAGGVLVSSGMLISSSLPGGGDLRTLYFTYGVLCGVGFSFSFSPSVMVVSKFFVKRRALATGIAVSGSGVGTLVLGPVCELIIERSGWRTCLQVLGILSGVVIVLAGTTYVPVQAGAAATTPAGAAGKAEAVGQSVSLVDDAASQPGVDQGALVVAVDADNAPPAAAASAAAAPTPPPPPPPPPPPASPPPRPKLSLLQTWRQPAFWPMAVVLCIYGGALFVPYSHIVVYGADLGLSRDASARLVSWLGLSGTVGRILFGRIADSPRISRVRLMQTSLCAAGIATFSVAFAARASQGAGAGAGAGSAEGALVAFALVFGLFSGSVVSMVPPIMVDFIGVENLPHAMGGLYTVQMPTALGGPPLAGYSRGVAGDYFGVWITCGILMILSPGVLAFMPRRGGGGGGKAPARGADEAKGAGEGAAAAAAGEEEVEDWGSATGGGGDRAGAASASSR